jgi:hypothetical protein
MVGRDNHAIIGHPALRWIALTPYLLSLPRIMAAFASSSTGRQDAGVARPLMPGGAR